MTDERTSFLAEQFEQKRGHLRAVAYRMLGSASEADDAVQEAWLRMSRSDTSAVDNLGGWLTTVVARLCLDTLRTRRARREDTLDAPGPDRLADRPDAVNPERDTILSDSVGSALLVILDTLAPAERLAFVLHDLFAVPFEEIARIVERSPVATRQLASRARRRVQGAEPVERDRGRQREIVQAFLQASREGKFDALFSLLDPDAVVRGDRTAVDVGGGEPELRGAEAVARSFVGRATGVQPALVDGEVGAVWAPEGRQRVVLAFTIVGGRVAEIDVIMDPDHLAQIEWSFLKE